MTRRALAVLHALIMISSSMSEVLGLTGWPFWSYDTHDVLIMYTSCSRTDSYMRTISSPASFFETLERPSGTPRRLQIRCANSGWLEPQNTLISASVLILRPSEKKCNGLLGRRRADKKRG